MTALISFARAAAGILAVIAIQADAHMQVQNPPPRGSRFNTGYSPTDYNLMAPATAICQGKPAGNVVKTLVAGEQSSIEFVPSGSPHGGGGCQISLSYDDGKTFTAIHTTDRSCPLENSITFTVPANAPSCEKCVLAWTWVPTISGGPEFYMNCMDVSIKGTATEPLTGPATIFVNLPGYPTRKGSLFFDFDPYNPANNNAEAQRAMAAPVPNVTPAPSPSATTAPNPPAASPSVSTANERPCMAGSDSDTILPPPHCGTCKGCLWTYSTGTQCFPNYPRVSCEVYKDHGYTWCS